MPPASQFLALQERLSRKGSARWRSVEGDRLFEWDALHREVEVYDRRGSHLGAADAVTGEIVQPAVRGRRIDV